MKRRPCKDGVRCVWGNRIDDTTVVCSMPRCVMTDEAKDRQFKAMERMMSSHDTYGRRGGRVKQVKHGDG